MNMLSILRQREMRSWNYKNQLYIALEKSFNDGNYMESYYKLNSTVVTSTIAIDISSDGEYVASSHGDHTIKVFAYSSGQQIRNFYGHPRTPWTVKFNPKDSNIVASGCLGYEARIWNIQLNTCLNVMKYDFSIITMSFHPSAELLAVASGQMLRFWNWRKVNRLSSTILSSSALQNLKEQDRKYPNHDYYCRSIVNERSIRAVVFHPSGNYVFIAAPYLKRDEHKRYALSSSGLTPCRLYCVNYRDLFDDYPKRVLDLQSQPILLSEMHVYSDGGIDISRDGNYIVVCGMLLIPRPIEPVISANSLMQHLKTSSNSSFNHIGNYHNLSNHDHNHDHFTMSTPITTSNYDNMSLIPPMPPYIPASDSMLSAFTLPIPSYPGVSDTHNRYDAHNQPPPLPLPSSYHIPPPNTSTIIFEDHHQHHQQHQYDEHHDGSSATIMPPTPLTSRSIPLRQTSGCFLKEHICVFELIIDKHHHNDHHHDDHDDDHHSSSNNPSPRGTTSIPTSASARYDDIDFSSEDYTECHAISSQEIIVQLRQCKALTSSLMKAIVSTKFSPSSRYVVLGYGVRTSSKEVEDHVNKRVACEIVDTTTAGLDTVAYFTHPEDEVNVSLFHPLPGLGLVYGTKTGKLRVFRRALSSYNIDDNNNVVLDVDMENDDE